MDQARKLREIAKERESQNRVYNRGNSKIISVTSGKGGVGKTSLVVNMAAKLAKSGKKILIIDADLGLADVQILIGIASPSKTLKDLYDDNLEIEDIIIKGPFNIDFISGGNGFGELADLTDYEREEFLLKMQKLDEIYDIIIVDTGAGISKNVISFLMIADFVVVIATIEPTSLTDAYSLIKVIKERGEKKELGLIMNRVKDIKEYKKASDTIIKTTKQFLDIDIQNLGFIYEDPNVQKAIFKKIPFVLNYTETRATSCIDYILRKLSLETDLKKSGIVDKFKKWLKQTGR